MSRVTQPLSLTNWVISLLILVQTVASHRSCNSHSHRAHTNHKGCEKLTKFLQDVLEARDELSWIDHVADEIRSKELFQSNLILQDKVNALFFNKEKRVWNPEENKNRNEIHERRKRNLRQTESSRLKVENEKYPFEGDTSSYKEDFNSRKRRYENALPHEQNFNSMTSSEQLIRMKNAIPTTANPLEKVLQSINVFPVEDDPYMHENEINSTSAIKFNDDSSVTPSSIINDTPIRHFIMGRSLKSVILDINSPKTKFIKSSNGNNRAEIIRTMNGNLAKEIINAILYQVQNEGIIMPVNSQKRIDERIYSRKLTSEGNDAAVITKKLMEFVRELIANEVEKKACASLPPDLYGFLQWLLESENYERSNAPNTSDNDKLLINNNLNHENITSLDAWMNRAELLRNLLNEYEELPKREKHKAQTISEYMATRLEFVESYIKALKSHLIPMDDQKYKY